MILLDPANLYHVHANPEIPHFFQTEEKITLNLRSLLFVHCRAEVNLNCQVRAVHHLDQTRSHFDGIGNTQVISNLSLTTSGDLHDLRHDANQHGRGNVLALLDKLSFRQ
jgi:hypothetical protein